MQTQTTPADEDDGKQAFYATAIREDGGESSIDLRAASFEDAIADIRARFPRHKLTSIQLDLL